MSWRRKTKRSRFAATRRYPWMFRNATVPFRSSPQVLLTSAFPHDEYGVSDEEEQAMQEHQVRSVVERYFHCVNSDDWEGLRELWHPECVTTPVDGPQRH